DLATAGLVNELFRGLGDDGIAVVVEPVDERADRRVLLILDDGGVIERAQQIATGLEFTQQTLVVDIETERLRRRIEICAVNDRTDLVTGYGHFSLLIEWGRARFQRRRLPTSLTVMVIGRTICDGCHKITAVHRRGTPKTMIHANDAGF